MQLTELTGIQYSSIELSELPHRSL